jgi:hypothetical protein
MLQKAKHGAGVGRLAYQLIKAYPKLSNSQIAALVREAFHSRGESCACSAGCIGWYRAKSK